jgi:hypothetical protein
MVSRGAIPGVGHLLIGQPEMSEGLARALQLKGEAPQYIEGQYGLSINALDLTTPEFLWTRRTVRLSQGIGVGAVAAQFSQAAFTPIAGAARSLAVVESLILTNTTGATAMTFFVDSQPNIAVGPAPAAIPKSALDDRAIPFNALQPTPSFGWVSATAAVAITGVGALAISVPPSTTFTLPLNWVFTARPVLTTPAPSSLLVQVSVVNLSLNCAAVWRERALLASEST